MTTMREFMEVKQIIDRLFPVIDYGDDDMGHDILKQDARMSMNEIFAPIGSGDAVLAGGFLRDFILDKPFNDVDVMSNMDPKGVVMKPLHEDDPRYVHNDIDAVGYSKIGRFNFNFIKLRLPTCVGDTIERIDFGLCRIAWARGTGLVISDDFFHDVDHGIITNYRTGWGETGVSKHYSRIKDRYPWPLVQAGEKT